MLRYGYIDKHTTHKTYGTIIHTTTVLTNETKDGMGNVGYETKIQRL